jgi:hypothetical protein
MLKQESTKKTAEETLVFEQNLLTNEAALLKRNVTTDNFLVTVGI